MSIHDAATILPTQAWVLIAVAVILVAAVAICLVAADRAAAAVGGELDD